MVLMIDNYDSFTFNIVQYLRELGANIHVVRNDEVTVDQIHGLQPERIVISPGPCTPNEAGISVPVVRAFAGQLPILGVCLGHQCIAQAFGGSVVAAKKIMHGKTSYIHHQNMGVFHGIHNPLVATRYHSLVVNQKDFPQNLEVTAWSEGEFGALEDIMGLKHKYWPVEGVQFHPESILSEGGHDLLKNFLAL